MDLSFLNFGSELLKAIVGHAFWLELIGCFVMIELILYVASKNKLHLIGVIGPMLIAAAWVGRAAYLARFGIDL